MIIWPSLFDRVVGNPSAKKGAVPNFKNRDLLGQGEGSAGAAADQSREVEGAMANQCETPVDETNRGATEVNVVGAEIAVDKSHRSLPKVG